jgi:peptide/nickel transport system ATP-binding protein
METETKSSPVLELRDVTVQFEKAELMGFGKSETVHAVDGVSLKIPQNDVVAIVGESGCGKTTLGKTAVGLQRPTDGEVLYKGQNFWETKDRPFWSRSGSDEFSFGEMRRSLQIIHQDPESSLNPNYKVISLLSDPLKRWESDLSEADRRERIHGLLSFAGMEPPDDYAQRYPHQLSGGETQRVALIRALLMNPDLILADEAISALDVSLRIEMMDLMLRVQNQFNTSFFFISHDLSNARYLAGNADGRIGVMYLGEIVEIGPVDEIINDPQHPYTKSLLWATSDVFEKKGAEHPPIRSLDIPDPTNPPSGCRFHTRCPEAHEVCSKESPDLVQTSQSRRAACFRTHDDHPYWDSEPLSGTEKQSVEKL